MKKKATKKSKEDRKKKREIERTLKLQQKKNITQNIKILYLSKLIE